ncbi:Clp1-domain-containing protein [Mollisia scopiformis]|uniref:Polynucleotide 5'-hydroxyl-kinase GRC3 n=1 Tax=Mollisia scopiformis TaxID=149040 RepID=A0A194X7Y2_MOLSC|nr:Clp1-domain-containing protein [Mollisia scopiformis]KUJ16273.1 Clp1-domain-containing protein [Mollisia scopiformis]
MSIPGLGQAAPTAAFLAPIPVAPTVVHDLQANSEWRFEVDIGEKIDVKILSGTAEIFGTELAVNHLYTFRGAKSSIYTWHGCRIEVTGVCEEYTAEETPMTQYVNTHFALEKLRDEAERDRREGPRVLVVGPTNSGKTSLVKLLAAYALRMGQQPMVINTDSREGLLSIPGSLTATPFASIIDVEQGWGSSPTSTSTPVPVKLPLCYYYGLGNPEDNTKLYKPIITRLALAATSRLTDDPAIKSTGMIIDTPGVISQGKGGFDLISHIVSEFSVNTILVIGSERLHSEMLRRFSTYRTSTGETITLVKLDKSGGCVDRDDTFMQLTNEATVKEYFFGDTRTTLSPHTQSLGYDEVTVYKIREAHTNSFLPGGVEETDHGLYEKVEPNASMQHCILAVMYASVSDSQDTIRDASVMGFVYVAEVDETKRRLKVLAPMNTRMTDRPMIWGSWPEVAVSLMG